jgi:hypothetical protein
MIVNTKLNRWFKGKELAFAIGICLSLGTIAYALMNIIYGSMIK